MKAIAILLLCALAHGDTVSQEYQCDLDLLAGETYPFLVEPFDTALGTLTDVRYVVEDPVLTCSVRMRNTTAQPIVAFAVQANVIPRLSGWSAPGWCMGLIDRACNVFPWFPPGWAHWFTRTYQFHHTSSVSLGVAGFDAPRVLVVEPDAWVPAYVFPFAPWPGTLTVLEFRYSQTFRIEFEYNIQEKD